MRFALRKLTLLDYPGIVACTIFSCGCNFRCPFCHNPDLVSGREADLEYSFADILEFLEERTGKVDGICITGGEPLLHEDTALLIESAKAMGYKVKLDTNGSFPERLQQIIDSGNVDYVAMDIKNSPAKYALTAGTDHLEKVRQSAALLMENKIVHEFRTTVTGNLHGTDDFREIGKWISGTEKYFLQPFADSGAVLSGNAEEYAVSDAQLQEFLTAVREFVPSAEIRGR